MHCRVLCKRGFSLSEAGTIKTLLLGFVPCGFMCWSYTVWATDTTHFDRLVKSGLKNIFYFPLQVRNLMKFCLQVQRNWAQCQTCNPGMSVLFHGHVFRLPRNDSNTKINTMWKTRSSKFRRLTNFELSLSLQRERKRNSNRFGNAQYFKRR